MIKGVPILAYRLIFGINSAMMLEKSILVTFSFIRQPIKGSQPLNGGPFIAAFPFTTPMVLKLDNLGKYTRVVATQKQVLSAFHNDQ